MSKEAEEEYFARIEREQKARLSEEIAKEKAVAERKARKELHFMKCGKCGGDLHPRPFRGVEIDVCADCGVVLLDPGELEQLSGSDEGGVISSIANLFGGRRK